jgi:glycosyltransferase involved in cell wall biosynthesis
MSGADWAKSSIVQALNARHDMNIVCISASKVPSSAANSIQAMKACQALAQLEHTITLLVPAGSGDGSMRPVDDQQLEALYGLRTLFRVEWIPSRPVLKHYDFCWTAVRRARMLKADIVYVWPLQAAVFGLLNSLPVILEMHGPPEGSLGPWLFRFFLHLGGRKRLLPITQALERMLEHAYHDPGSMSRVSPNGVDIEGFEGLPVPSEARRALGLRDALTVGYTGHLYSGRGMGLLVELARRFPQVQFLWVGGRSEDVHAWQERLSAEGLANVTLTGFIENSRLPMFQAAADVLLMPYERSIQGSSGGDSAAYASPMKMFDYMACKRAIISSDLPVIREVLNESNAVLCPPEDVSAWAAALEKLLRDQEKGNTLARQAWQDVQQYTWQRRAQKALDGF